ncbi:MAG: hypothetical protein Phog2KO_06620 [Phototrophicaceae bacterium]
MKRLIILLIIASLTFSSIAQEDEEGDKTLPGEGEIIETATVNNIDLGSEDAIQEMLAQGDIEITLEDLVLDIDFSDEDDWEFYEEDTRFVMVDDGVYVAQAEDNATIWGQNTEPFEDGLIEVVATQDGGADNNAFGVMCRANEDNNLEGYHFWIASDGFAAIFLYEDNDDGYTALVDWFEADVINLHTENILHVVCVGEYLAFYVNGELIAEVEDDTYDEGVTGLSLSNIEDGEYSRALFDDLRIWEADD